MDYKKLYKEALKRAKKLYEQGTITESIGYIFPELKESENERIRKALIDYFNKYKEQKECGINTFYGIPTDNILAWLEKQESVGEIVERCKTSWYNEGKIQGQIEGLSDDEKYQQGWHDALEKQGEQKPVISEDALREGNAKLKFKVGDWVVYDHRTYQVVELPKEGYINLGLRRNGKIEFAPSTYCRPWTIKDANDGDVLYSPCCKLIWIYKDEKTCYLGNNLNYHSDSIVVNNPICMPTDARPATKDEQTTFFAKIKELGYEWDAEEKELKNTETKGGEG